jgi:hypothetical protein
MHSFKGARKACRHCLGGPADGVVRQQTDAGSGQTAYGVGAQTAYGVGAQPLPVIKFPPPSQSAQSQVNGKNRFLVMNRNQVWNRVGRLP